MNNEPAPGSPKCRAFPRGHPRFDRGLRRFAPVVSVAVLAAGMVLFLVPFRAWPTDAWTYLAAAERLNAGHTLYALQPGDRPVFMDPATVSVPLLSPPFIAVLWRPIARMPPEAAVGIWWLGSTLCLAALLATASSARPGLGLASTLIFALPMAFLAVTGNVNGYLAAGTATVWWAARRGRVRLAGFLIALMSAAKVVPATLLLWLLATRQYRAASWAGLAVVGLLAVSAAGAGVENHRAYLDVIRHTASAGQSTFSLTGIALSLGIAEAVARLLPSAALAIGGTVTWLAGRRGHPAGSFTAAVYTMVLGSPVVNFDWLALMFAGLAPAFWPVAGRLASDERDRRSRVGIERR